MAGLLGLQLLPMLLVLPCNLAAQGKHFPTVRPPVPHRTHQRAQRSHPANLAALPSPLWTLLLGSGCSPFPGMLGMLSVTFP